MGTGKGSGDLRQYSEGWARLIGVKAEQGQDNRQAEVQTGEEVNGTELLKIAIISMIIH